MSKTINITPDFHWIGILDPDLRIFDIVMETEFGTTYNSYLLKGSNKIAIFETAKAQFFDDYIAKIESLIHPSDIDYIILNHTEPDHTGSVVRLLELAPHATVVGTSQAMNFVSKIINRPFNRMIVKDGDTLSLGNKTIHFIMAPFLHWPDTMYSYVEEDKLLITCDSFGEHYSDGRILKSELELEKEEEFLRSYKYYFDMIMGPFKPFVLQALNKIKDLDIAYICPGHGMVLDQSNMQKYIDLYKEWATVTPRQKPSIIIPYVSAYGYTEQLAHKIAEGIQSIGKDVDVLLYDMVYADHDEVMSEIGKATGVLFGSPTIVADALPPIWRLLTSLNPFIHKGLKAGCFGSYGWSGEAIKNMEERIKQLRFNMPVAPLKVLFKPSDDELQSAFDFGAEFAAAALPQKSN